MIMRQREQLMRVDGVVLAVTLALSMATGLAVGAAAGWRSSRAAVRHAGDPQHRAAGQRPSHVLVVVQIAAAMVLLACAGLLFQSVSRLADVKSGVQPEHVLVFRVLLPAPDYPTPELQRGFVERLADALRALPGVESAGVSMDGQMLSSSAFSSFDFRVAFVETLLFGITSRDVTTMVVVAVLLAAIGVLACYVPARRAALVDPVTVLRSE